LDTGRAGDVEWDRQIAPLPQFGHAPLFQLPRGAPG
jgi:hypothetical protein